MASEKELRISVTSDFQGKGFDDAAKATKKLQNSTSSLGESSLFTKNSVGALFSIIAAKETVQAFVTVSDSMKLLESRINIVSGAADNYIEVQRSLLEIANKNRTSIESVGVLYTKLKDPLTKLGYTTQSALEVTDAFSKALLIGGASTEEAASATLQFAQAMASGRLQGDEFRSIAEASPKILQILTKELGITTAELRQMASDGKLTAGVIGGALLRAYSDLNNESEKIKPTVGGAFQVLKNELSIVTEKFDKATGANDKLVSGLTVLTELIKGQPEKFSRLNPVVDELYNTAEKLNNLKINDDSFLGLLKSGNSDFSANDSLTQTVAKAYNATGKALYGVLSESWNIVDQSAGEWAKIIDKSYSGMEKWANSLSESFGITTLSTQELNQEFNNIPDRAEKVSQSFGDMAVAAKTFAAEERRLRDEQSGDYNSSQKLKADLIKEQTARIEAQISTLDKQFTISKEIDNLNIESAQRNEKISSVEAEYLKEINDIKSQIAKNQATINLLNSKEYTGTEADKNKASDLEKINGLQKEDELLKLKLVAADERRQVSLKAVNNELDIAIKSIGMSETDKKYQDLSKSVQDLINKGADLKLVGEYATKLADQIERDGAYTHLQTELDIRSQIAEVSLYGAQKETALEQIRHDGVMANLSRELETKKLNADEYLKLLAIENQRHAQNSDSFYKFMLDAFNNIEKAMDENFFNAMTGKFKSFGDWLKDLFKNIGTSIAQGLSRTIAGNITQSLEGGIVNMYRSYGGLGTSASLVGSTLSASDMSSLLSSGATVSDGVIKTAGGTVIDQASGTVTSQGSDALSLLNTASSLKTVYNTLTGGISSTIMSGFNSVADILAGQGYWSAASGVSNFGYGVANPFSYGAGSGAFGSTTAGAALSGTLMGGLAGYGIGSLGDKIFGASTYAGTTGAIGGALGGLGGALGLWGGPIGIIAGSIIGSVLGGIFGKTKQTGSGIDILGNATAQDASGQYWQSYSKKSWFSSKSWTNYTPFSDEEIKAIKSTIGVYDYLLEQLGNYNDLVVSGGRFSNLQSFLDTNVVQAFLVSINPSNLSTIYQSWVDYAAEIDKTITEAISTAVSGYTTYKRGYTEWFLGSGTVEQLAFTSNYLQKDFEALASSLGASSVTVDNFLSMYDAAIKNNFTQDTIEAWASLGDALMKSTDATKKYKDALDSLNGSTTYSLPVDTMLTKVNNTSQQIDLKQLVTTQTGQNDTVINLLVQSVKTLQSILKEAQFGKAIV